MLQLRSRWIKILISFSEKYPSLINNNLGIRRVQAKIILEAVKDPESGSEKLHTNIS